MQFDLHHIRNYRATLLGRGPMDYVLNRIRRDLEQRIERMSGVFECRLEHGLVIDFENGDLTFDCSSRENRSLLEAGRVGQSYLQEFDHESLQYVVIHLQMAWLDFESLLSEVRRVLKPGGVVFFASLGPDTLGELAYAWAQVDQHPHVHPFVDMHFVGDALARLGFSQPIVDTDWLTVEYDNVGLLLDDLKSEGFVNLLPDRRKTLTGKARMEAFRQELVESFSRNGTLPINFEIIFGFARIPTPEATVRVNAPVYNSQD